MQSIEHIESLIHDAINQIIVGRDFTLIHSDFGNVKQKCACPLGCLLLSQNKKIDSIVDLQNILSVDREWILSFVAGYDNAGYHQVNYLNKKAEQLGKQFYDQYNPIEYYKLIQSC